ncbi:MAG: hypothetical protein WAL04_01490 [Acidimicrobiales bacterium]|jgi:hypothetical protein
MEGILRPATTLYTDEVRALQRLREAGWEPETIHHDLPANLLLLILRAGLASR